MSARRRILRAVLALPIVAAAVYGILALSAQPAPDHPFFAAEKPGVQVIAHRGGAGLRPESTLAAFAHAVEIGVDVLDTDVRRTADGAIVCIHDATVDRTTGGSGRVASFRLDELQRLDAGYRWSDDGGRTFPFRGKGIRVPSLEEVFGRFPAMRFVIEMKDADTSFAQSLCALIRRSGMTAKALIASFGAQSLLDFRSACPEVATSLGGAEARMFFAVQRLRLSAAYSPPAAAAQIPYRLGETAVATQGFVEAAHRRNLKVHVWTVNDEQQMRQLLQLGVDGMITDRPDRLLDVRRPR